MNDFWDRFNRKGYELKILKRQAYSMIAFRFEAMVASSVNNPPKLGLLLRFLDQIPITNERGIRCEFSNASETIQSLSSP
jgi:hypothetical protein